MSATRSSRSPGRRAARQLVSSPSKGRRCCGADSASGGAAPGGGGFLQAKDLMARGEDIDYEGAAGPIEFDADRNNVRGTVEIWRVDPQAHGFLTGKAMTFD